MAACELFKGKTFKVYNWMLPVVVLQTPEAVEVLLSSSEHLRKPLMYTFLIPWLGEKNILTGTDDTWKLKRKIGTPAFHFKTLGTSVHVFNEHGNAMVKKIDEVADKKKATSIYRYIQRCVLDIVTEFSTGVNPRTQDDDENEFGKCLNRMNFLICVRAFRPWLWPQFIYDRTAEGRQFKATMAVMGKFSGEIVDERAAKLFHNKPKDNGSNADPNQPEEHTALLDFLFEKSFHKIFTIAEIKKDIDSLFFAANDTTSTALSWLLYLLGLHPEKQRKVQKELDEIFQGDTERDITTGDLTRMKYLEFCVKESLRLYPSVPLIGRILDSDLVIDGYTIPKGVTCMISIFSLHRNPKSFHKPEEFIPERFEMEEFTSRHPYSYIPFSGGLKNCLGQRFAMTEMKLIVAKVLLKYDLAAKIPLDKLRLTCEVVVRPKEGHHLWIRRRRPPPISTGLENTSTQSA